MIPFLNIFKYVQLAAAAVATVEGTFTADAGASKQEKAIDLINNEAKLVGAEIPVIGALVPSIVNMVVAGFNLVGLFTHKAK